MQATVAIPDLIAAGQPWTARFAEVQRLLRLAVAHALAPQPFTGAAAERRTLHLTPRLSATVALAQRQRPRPAGHVVTELLMAAIAYEAGHATSSPSDGPAASLASGLASAALTPSPATALGTDPGAWRPAQQELRTAIATARAKTHHAIVLAEAATGIGKSRVLGVLALEALPTASPEAPVVVAAPTMAVLHQLIREARLVDDAAVRLHSAVLIGRAQFVDVGLLQQWVDMPPADWHDAPDFAVVSAAVRAWINAGGPPVLEARTTEVHALNHTLRWLMDDLAALAPAWPIREFALLADADPNPGADAYAAHREAARDAAWVWCTHAMLAQDSARSRRHQSGAMRFPRIHCLLLDEAHQFDAILAQTVGHDLALSRVFTDCRRAITEGGRTTKQVAQEALAAGQLVFDAAQSLLRDDTQHTIPPFAFTGSEAHAYRALALSLLPLAGALRQLATGQRRLDPTLRARIARAGEVVGLLHRNAQWIAVSASAVRRWPSFQVGATTLAKDYARLWARVETAVLCSATLTLPSPPGHGGHARPASYEHLATEILHVPAARCAPIPPVQPAWVKAPVQLQRPPLIPAAIERLTPPSRAAMSATAERAELSPWDATTEDPRAHDVAPFLWARWWQAVAEVLEHRVLRAGSTVAPQGGTLVLCASFADVSGLSDALMSIAPSLADRIVRHLPDRGVAVDLPRFVAAAQRGERPVWFATGGAWTGLDLRDPDAIQARADQVLTDLVIPRVPWRQNRTMVHAARCRRNAQKFEPTDTALLLRQGMGRLVRREGVGARRLWILDPRPWVGPAARTGFYTIIQQLLQSYPNWRTFEPPAAWVPMADPATLATATEQPSG